MFAKIKDWVTIQWKAIVGFLAVAIAAAGMYARTKSQKKVLDIANKSHKKELDVNKHAEEKLLAASEKIKNSQLEDVAKIEKDYKKQKEVLIKEKKDFVEESLKDNELAKKLAKKIGADFVE